MSRVNEWFQAQLDAARADAFREGVVASAGIARKAVNGIVGQVTTEQAILTAASEPAHCKRCNGNGAITVCSGQTPDSYQEDNIDCPDCAASEPAKVPEVCEWTPVEGYEDWYTSGCNEMGVEYDMDMKFCPFCGKTIIAREG